MVQNLKREMVTLGPPDESFSAIEAMLAELAASSGHCAWLRARITNMSEEELGTPEGLAVVKLYDGERDRRVRIARMCVESGVDEAAIRVAEIQMTMLGQALKNALDEANLSATMQKRVGESLRKNLMHLETERGSTKLLNGR